MRPTSMRPMRPCVQCVQMRRRPPGRHAAAPPATLAGRPAERRPHPGRPQFEPGRPQFEPGKAWPAARRWPAARPARFWGWPARISRAAGRVAGPIWRLAGRCGRAAGRSPLRADSTTYRTPVPVSAPVSRCARFRDQLAGALGLDGEANSESEASPPPSRQRGVTHVTLLWVPGFLRTRLSFRVCMLPPPRSGPLLGNARSLCIARGCAAEVWQPARAAR